MVKFEAFVLDVGDIRVVGSRRVFDVTLLHMKFEAFVLDVETYELLEAGESSMSLCCILCFRARDKTLFWQAEHGRLISRKVGMCRAESGVERYL